MKAGSRYGFFDPERLSLKYVHCKGSPETIQIQANYRKCDHIFIEASYEVWTD